MNYRLEFNEDQQMFHLDSGEHQPNTFGWFTVLDKCSYLEYQVYDSFVYKTNKKRLTKKYLLQCVDEMNKFIQNLEDHELVIC